MATKDILPSPSIPQGPGLTGPDYSFADSLLLPGQVGVRDGNSMNDVMDSVKAVGYYVDMIGFGESSSPLSRDLPVKPIGINYWMPTGMKCSNGADMWVYNEGIPKGDALGKRVADGLRSAGLPGMRGLAPGMIEDAKVALNPVPMLQAVFGSGYPQCKLESQPVGDQDGNIKNPQTGEFYIQNPETIEQKNGRSYQTRWVFSRSLTQDQWENAPKTHCPDGYLIKGHRNLNCNEPIENRNQEGFIDSFTPMSKGSIFLGVGVLTTLLFLRAYTKK